jgi:uncharacterized protein YciI
MKKLAFCFLLVFIFTSGVSYAQDKKMPEGMKTYYLVLLKKGPNRTQDSVTAAKIQAGHMAHINEMAAAGKLNVAGPCSDNGDLRGIFIFNVASIEEARALTESDPAVKSGRLIMEIHPWMSQKGICLQ